MNKALPVPELLRKLQNEIRTWNFAISAVQAATQSLVFPL